VRSVYFRLYVPLLLLLASLTDNIRIRKSGFRHVPPVSLRYRVSGTTKLKEFMDVGKRNAHEIETGLEKIGVHLDSMESMLDFGCGCGRTLLWFRGRKPRIYGTDIDADAIRWVTENLDFATFTVNNALPPLEYADNFFEFIYSISIFTHINEDYQFQWLKELKRVLKPGGILIVTVHGKGAYGSISSKDVAELQKTGFKYIIIPNYMRGFFPSWYQGAYHTKEYVFNTFGNYFKVLDYIEKGINNHQDLIILQKN
jgi:ubiquinone/menaquinone biosynthesis C-methylase UbiE